MCTITEHHFNWAMNIESDASSHPRQAASHIRADGAGSPLVGNAQAVARDDLSLRSGSGLLEPQEMPAGYTPRPGDVLLGRGKKNWRHHGNASFRKLIHSNVPSYMDATTKHDKTLVVKSIVDIVRSNGGRFLKQGNDGSWYDIGDSQAKEKVGHSLRDQVTALSKQKKDSAASVASSTLREQTSALSQPRIEGSVPFIHTPRRSSSASLSSRYSASQGGIGGQGSTATAVQRRGSGSTSPSPLNIIHSLPSDLSGILEQIHFPSIQSSGAPQRSLSSLPLTTGATVETTALAAAAQMNPRLYSSAPNFNTSFSSLPQGAASGNSNNNNNNSMVNFFEPLDESMEPIPIREFPQAQQQQQQQGPPQQPSSHPDNVRSHHHHGHGSNY